MAAAAKVNHPMLAAGQPFRRRGRLAAKGMAAAAVTHRRTCPAATLAEVPDPGAMAVGFWLRAVATALPQGCRAARRRTAAAWIVAQG